MVRFLPFLNDPSFVKKKKKVKNVLLPIKKMAATLRLLVVLSGIKRMGNV